MEWSEFGSWTWSPQFQRYYRQRQNQYQQRETQWAPLPSEHHSSLCVPGSSLCQEQSQSAVSIAKKKNKPKHRQPRQGRNQDSTSSATTTPDSGSDPGLDNPPLPSADENSSYTTCSPDSSYHNDLDVVSVPRFSAAAAAAAVATSYKVNSHGVHVQGKVASDGGPLVRQDSVPEVDIYDSSAYNTSSQYNVDPMVLQSAMESLQLSQHAKVSTSVPHDRPSQISIEGTSLIDLKEVLDPRYQVHKSTSFQPGEVFKVLWSEPVGKSVATSSSAVSGTQTFVDSYGERFYVGFRRFIVVANDAGHCTCVPILTYGGRGCQKSGVKPDRHGIVVQSGKRAKPAPGEPSLGFPPIRVQIRARGERLTRESRINYSKLVTVEHNVKVFFVGSILAEDADLLQDAVNQCWERKSFHRRPYTRVD